MFCSKVIEINFIEHSKNMHQFQTANNMTHLPFLYDIKLDAHCFTEGWLTCYLL
jgi:hypothetical protein